MPMECSPEEALKLTVYRALRGEIRPQVRAIVARSLTTELVELDIFHLGSADDLSDVEETVESELDQCLPAGLHTAPRLRCALRDAGEFDAIPSARVLYNNPWAR